jgi:hypothetical protein
LKPINFYDKSELILDTPGLNKTTKLILLQMTFLTLLRQVQFLCLYEKVHSKGATKKMSPSYFFLYFMHSSQHKSERTDAMPPRRLFTLTRGIQIRGQPIKKYKKQNI